MNIKEVRLNVELGDGGECAVLLAQPSVPLDPVVDSGFQISNLQKRAALLKLVEQICVHAKAPVSQDCDHAHFLIFPELSLTFEGFEFLEKYIRGNDCPNNTIIIAGLEGLSWERFEALLNRSDNPEPRYKPPAGTVDWVNCSILLTKEHTGEAKLYVQSKFRASQWEQARGRIFQGKDLLLFRLKTNSNKDFSFISLICSDFSAQDGGTTTIMEALDEIRNIASASSINLEFIFGLLHNHSLGAEPFPIVIQNIFNGDHSTLDLQDTALVFVNGAKSSTESGFGESSFFFHRDCWKIIGDNEAPSEWYATLKWPGDCRQYRLIVDSPCVFTLQYLPIRKTGRNAGSTRLPFKGVNCHAITPDGSLIISEAKGLHIVCETLLSRSKTYSDSLSSAPNIINLQQLIRGNYSYYKGRLLSEKENRLNEIMKLLFKFHNPNIQNYYYWTEPIHGKAMVIVLHILALLKAIGKELGFDSDELSTACIAGQLYLVVLDGNDLLTYGQLIEMYNRDLEDYPIIPGSKLIVLARTTSVPASWDRVKSHSQFYTERYPAINADVPNPYDAHFSPKEPVIGFFPHLQEWQEKVDEAKALTYLRGYLGQN